MNNIIWYKLPKNIENTYFNFIINRRKRIMDKSKKLLPNQKQCCGLNLGCYEFVEMQEKIKDLEHRLSNCIEPKFKIGEDVWCVKFMKIIKFKINKIEIYRGEAEEENRILYGNWEDMTYQIEENCFATEEEAKKRLEELNGE